MQIENKLLTIHFCKEIVNSNFRRQVSKGCFSKFILLQTHKQPLSKDFNLSIGLHESSTCFCNSSFSLEFFDRQILIFNICLFWEQLNVKMKNTLGVSKQVEKLTVLSSKAVLSKRELLLILFSL